MTYIERIHNAETGEVTERPFTAAEIKKADAAQAKSEAFAIELAAKEAAKQAVLDKLGLSAEEVAALLG